MSRLDQLSSFQMTRSTFRKSSLKTQINRKQVWIRQLGSFEELDDVVNSAYALSASPITFDMFQCRTTEQFVSMTPITIPEEENLQLTQDNSAIPEDVQKLQKMPSKGSPVLIKFKKRIKNYIPKMRTADKEQPKIGVITKIHLQPIQTKVNKSLSIKSKEFIKVKDKNNFDLRPCKTGQIKKLNTSMSSLMEKRKKRLGLSCTDEEGSNSSLI